MAPKPRRKVNRSSTVMVARPGRCGPPAIEAAQRTAVGQLREQRLDGVVERQHAVVPRGEGMSLEQVTDLCRRVAAVALTA